jgi:hypothetical protein
MELSEARAETNRRNSLKSTGPKSILGKSRSSKNALTHGFRAEVHAIEDPEAVRVLAQSIVPTPLDGSSASVDPLADWAAGQVATLSLRIERCQASELAVRERIVARAEVTWEEDRQLAATVLGGTITKRPEEVSARLRESYHGCGWLISRWIMLMRAADLQQGVWTPAQTRMAFDLLGTPPEFREGIQPSDPGESHAGLAGRQITELMELQDRLAPLDDADRERAEADLSDHSDPELRKLRRYEASLQRRLEWSIGLLQQLSTPQPTEPEPEPEAKPEPEAQPEAEAEAKAEPPDRSAAPSTIAPPSRAEKKQLRAEANRKARLRKLDGRRN